MYHDVYSCVAMVFVTMVFVAMVFKCDPYLMYLFQKQNNWITVAT